MLPSASEAAVRFQKYEQRYGLEEVERVIDAALSIELNVNPDFFVAEENEEQQKERLSTPCAAAESRGPFDDLISKKCLEQHDEDYYTGKTPLEPERDVLLYIMNHSPRPLKEWEKDIVSMIRQQSRYFMPQRRTKIMNEGWAAFWHIKIMERLFRERLLNDEDHGLYNLYNARVLAKHPRMLNPYLVGLKIFEDIEDRWNKGRFGKAWEECEDPAKRQEWDLRLGKGKEKMFEVRRRYSDRFFIEEFLTEELVDALDLYLYQGKREGKEIKYVISEKDWRRIKDLLVSHLSTFDIPLIVVEDGDYQGKRELYLNHSYEGVELDQEYREKTLEQVFYLWNRPVHLESVVNDAKTTFTFDGEKHEQRQGT
jgi:stage V sporulation protein R